MLTMSDMILEQHANLLRQGAILVDPADEGTEPWLLFLLTHEVKSGDGVVSREAQWSEDLQRQGIPAVILDATHPTAMRSHKSAEAIAKLAVTGVRRWQPARWRR